ncbi:hypothetical protein SAMN05660657_05540 [Geodermatophilus amargosae]|uniref:Uncharacterized protein n=1 Tax=Geodermatophilus amargosae TaxID=1296565 RepID=A0A1I7DAD5_9ACTN|nr:hypothetical protein SAMN05660657_05540 [Geodermatophilus amargosae]
MRQPHPDREEGLAQGSSTAWAVGPTDQHVSVAVQSMMLCAVDEFAQAVEDARQKLKRNVPASLAVV